MRDITNNAKRARFSSVKDATQAQVLNSEILFKTENNSKKQKEVFFFFLNRQTDEKLLILHV